MCTGQCRHSVWWVLLSSMQNNTQYDQHTCMLKLLSTADTSNSLLLAHQQQSQAVWTTGVPARLPGPICMSFDCDGAAADPLWSLPRVGCTHAAACLFINLCNHPSTHTNKATPTTKPSTHKLDCATQDKLPQAVGRREAWQIHTRPHQRGRNLLPFDLVVCQQRSLCSCVHKRAHAVKWTLLDWMQDAAEPSMQDLKPSTDLQPNT